MTQAQQVFKMLLTHMSSDLVAHQVRFLNRTRRRFYQCGLNGRTYVLTRKEALLMAQDERAGRDFKASVRSGLNHAGM